MLLLIFIMLGLHPQTNWMGGPGVKGPFTSWGTQYYTGDSITTATEGQVSLIATQTDYGNWEKHIIESNPGIQAVAQGLMPVDIDKDSYIDFIAHTNDSVVWYRNLGNWTYSKQFVGPAPHNGKISPCVWPEDVNKDSLIDILVATDGKGAGWYENTGTPIWDYHILDDSRGYHRICSADVDADSTIDIIAVDNTVSQYHGNIHLFRNTGSGFTQELIKDFKGKKEGFRVYTADFDKDGYPDIYSVHHHVYIFLNDKTGHFDSVYYFQWSLGEDFDGAWAQDIDMDGNIDLVTANVLNPLQAPGFYLHRNIGDGYIYSFEPLALCDYNYYSDGAIARDIDLDGLPDIAGTFTKVGWYRQDTSSTAPEPFEEHFIGRVTNSHWIYADDVDQGCVPDIDLIVTDQGAHIVYENRMLSRFALKGSLTSSILELDDQAKEIRWFGWTACVPSDSTLAFYWRGDTISSNIDTVTWNGPFYAKNNIDSIPIPTWPCHRYFQYKVEFYPDTLALDIAVLKSVWVKDTICGAHIEETIPVQHETFSLRTSNEKILLSTMNSELSTFIELSIYNIAGELVQTIYKGTISAGKHAFTPRLKTKGVYLVVLKWSDGIKTTKFIKIT